MNEAELYFEYNNKENNGTSAVLEKYFHLIQWNPNGGENVIDIGCGPGETTTQVLRPFLPSNLANLVGCDLTEEMVDFANSKYRDDVVKFIKLDITDEIPLELCGFFDHLFSFYALHWIHDQKNVFKNLHRLLKPGGDMFISFVANQTLYDAYKQIASSKKWSNCMKGFEKLITPYHACVDAKDIEDTVNKFLHITNFNVNLCKVMDWSFTYTDIEEFKNFAKSINPCLRLIPDDLIDDFTDDFTKYCITYDKSGREQVMVVTKLVVVFATK